MRMIPSPTVTAKASAEGRGNVWGGAIWLQQPQGEANNWGEKVMMMITMIMCEWTTIATQPHCWIIQEFESGHCMYSGCKWACWIIEITCFVAMPVSSSCLKVCKSSELYLQSRWRFIFRETIQLWRKKVSRNPWDTVHQAIVRCWSVSLEKRN